MALELKGRRDLFIDPGPLSVPLLRRARDRRHYIIIACRPQIAKSQVDVVAHADQLIEADTSSIPALVEAIRLAAPIDAVIVNGDRGLHQVAIACEICGVTFTSSDAVAHARDKRLTRQMLERHDLATVRHVHARSLDELRGHVAQVGFPCIIKPSSGFMSLCARRIQSVNDLDAVITDLAAAQAALPDSLRWALDAGYLCEKWLAGPIVSVGLASSGDHLSVFCVAVATHQEVEPCVGLGNVIPFRARPAIAEACIAYARQAAAAIGFAFGVADIEMIWTTRGPVLLEVNARCMGGEMPFALELATGLNVRDMILDTYAGVAWAAPTTDPGKVTVIRKLMPLFDGKVDAKMAPISGLQLEGTHFSNYRLTPGRSVARLEVLGRILVVADDAEVGFDIANRAVADLEVLTGLQFIPGKLPNIARAKGARST